MVKRRPIDNVLSFFNTCFCTGYIPFAPGTFASILAAVLIYCFPGIFTSIYFAGLCIIFGTVSINGERYEGKDPGHIVIDEFAGMCVAMAGHKASLTIVIMGLVLFRIFDIIKPFPINRVERLPGGWGVMADDVLAGVFSNILILAWTRFS
ncbi:MAG: pgpA [Deltaproteobacteria bacterium]|nr:pgpA [Deltaproteobacteria bacterium]